MKKTLTLLALTAALMPMIPHTAKGDTQVVSVKGVMIDTNDLSKSTGIFDADKTGSPYKDSLLCWAATCSNLIAWWEVQNADTLQPNTPTQHQQIWDTYRLTFQNFGGDIGQGLDWWLTGDYAKGEGKELKPWPGDYVNGMKTLSPDAAGFYQESLWKGEVDKLDIQNIIPGQQASVQAFSMALVSAINQGYGVGLSWVYPSNVEGLPPMGHAVTVWGAEYDTQTNLLTALYLTDSDNAHKEEGLVRVEVTSQGNTFVETARPSHSIESFTLLNSRLISDLNYFNYQDKDNHDVIVKQKFEDGTGFTITDELQDIGNIKFDGSRGSVQRLLTVEANKSVEAINVEARQGTNFVDVQQGVTLTADEVVGSGALTKTGQGKLKVSSDSTAALVVKDGVLELCGAAAATTAAITVDGGTLLCENGTLGEITLNSGGTLHGGGIYKNVTVNGGTLAVGNSPGQQQIKDTLTLTHANLEFYVAGWERAASLNDASWDSGTYSNIDMGYGKKFSMKTEDGIDSINIYVGGDALDALSTTGTFSLNLISDINSFDFYDSYLASMQGKTQFFVSDEAEALANTTWQAGQELTDYIDFRYIFENNSTWYSPSNLKLVGTFKGVAAPEVPEPTTGTLSLLALAGLCARRRRK